MGLGAMPRRQYEATWLGFPMKQVSLVTVGKQQPTEGYGVRLTAIQSSPSRTPHLSWYVAHSRSLTVPALTVCIAPTFLAHHATDSWPKISYIHGSVHE